MISDDLDHFSKFPSNNIQETRRHENDGNIDQFLSFSEYAPMELLKTLNPLFSESTVDQALPKCIDIILYLSMKNNKEISFSSLVRDFMNQNISNEKRIFSLTLIKSMIKNTPKEEKLDIPPDFINLLLHYFPHSLCINICSDLIKRDYLYFEQFSKSIQCLDENPYQECYISMNNFFLNLMKQDLYNALILLQSFLFYKENLIFMEPIFEEILSIISSCQTIEKIECFNVLYTFFECDDIFYPKLISNQDRLSSLFYNLEKNALLIESSLNFANEVTYSNDKKTKEFIKLTKLDQMIVYILPFINDHKVILFCCKICERLIYSDEEKGISFLLKKNIISAITSIKSSFSLLSFQTYMHMISKCVIKGSNSQITSLLSMIPLIDFGNYIEYINGDEASLLFTRIATVILNNYETTGDIFVIDEDTYNELSFIAEQENDEINPVTDFLKSIYPILEQNGIQP